MKCNDKNGTTRDVLPVNYELIKVLQENQGCSSRVLIQMREIGNIASKLFIAGKCNICREDSLITSNIY